MDGDLIRKEIKMTENFPDEGIRWANPSRTKIKYWRKIPTSNGVKKFTVYGDSPADVYKKMCDAMQPIAKTNHVFGVDVIGRTKPCKACPFMYCINCLHKEVPAPTKEQNEIGFDGRRCTKNNSGKVGVYWDKFHKKFIAHIGYKGKVYYGGAFSSFEEAVEAREFLERNIKGLA